MFCEDQISKIRIFAGACETEMMLKIQLCHQIKKSSTIENLDNILCKTFFYVF